MRKFFKVLSLFLCLSLFLIPLNVANAHTHGGYSHDSNVGLSRPDWMSGLSDEITINQLSIPGTGNSMSYGKHTDFTLTQSMDLETQLNSGIRFLDLGLNNSDGTLEVYTGGTALGVNLANVIKRVSEFLAKHREETVLIRLYPNLGDASDFPYLVKQNIEKANLSDFIFDGSNSKNPKLGEVRGQIILLADYSGSRWREIPYRDSTSIQDNNYLATNWDLYSKWEKVKEHLDRANKTKGYGLRNINYLTGSGGSFPYFVASGHVSSGTGAARLSTFLTEPGFKDSYPDFPRVNGFGVFSTIAFEGTNILTLNYILRNDLDFVGIIVADFPGAGLIEEIINLNFKEKNNNSNSNNNNSNNSNNTTNTNINTGGWGFTYKNSQLPKENEINNNFSGDITVNGGFWSSN